MKAALTLEVNHDYLDSREHDLSYLLHHPPNSDQRRESSKIMFPRADIIVHSRGIINSHKGHRIDIDPHDFLAILFILSF
jgi:hypothetical protein